MRKFFSISLVLLVLISGMHLSFATHICGGEVAAVKWSFSGEKATCGMEAPKQTCPAKNSIDQDCCHNYIANFSVDSNYNSSDFQVTDISKNLLQTYYVSVNILFNQLSSPIVFYTDVGPHHNLQTSAVSLVEICVFRV